jgi:hypothetical protein
MLLNNALEALSPTKDQLGIDDWGSFEDAATAAGPLLQTLFQQNIRNGS